jgi:O-antigen/teichoic acid export membrane protein
MACDRAKEYLKAVGFGAAISVALNLALIPKLGLMGAGLARLTCSAIISLYFWFQFRRVSRLNWLQHIFKPTLASALMVLVMVLVGHSWILQMALGTLVYAGTILLIGPSERTQVLRIAKAIFAPSGQTTFSPASSTGERFRASEEPLPTETVER